jgi:DNA-binding CsgD family transcriptional regulator
MKPPWTRYKDMTDYLHRIFNLLEASKSIDDLRLVMDNITRSLKLTNMVYHSVGYIGSPDPSPLLVLTYSPEWVTRYFSENYLQIDPVVNGGLRGLMPTDWAMLEKTGSRVRQFFGEASEHGVGRQGLTTAIRGPRGESALFTFTSDVSDLDWPQLKSTLMPPMLLIGHAFHLRAMELLQPDTPTSAPKLSRREVDCLQYCAHGFRDHETAQKLKISEAVVRAYLDSARHKLASPTRPYAIAKALKLRVIRPPL